MQSTTSLPAAGSNRLECIQANALAASRRALLGIRFHVLTHAQTLRLIEEWIQQKQPKQICLANAYSVQLCWDHPAYRHTLDAADLVLADGMSIVWGGRSLGIPFPERIAGPDLMESLCARGSIQGWRFYLMGSSPRSLQLLSIEIQRRWPELNLCGMRSPSQSTRFSDDETTHLIDRIREARPDILFVGVSTPKQDLWIAENLNRLQVPVCIGVGAAFDFMSGIIPRAPEIFQRSGFEWLYRLSREPRRLWKRYLLGNAIFLSHLFWAHINRRVTALFRK